MLIDLIRGLLQIIRGRLLLLGRILFGGIGLLILIQIFLRGILMLGGIIQRLGGIRHLLGRVRLQIFGLLFQIRLFLRHFLWIHRLRGRWRLLRQILLLFLQLRGLLLQLLGRRQRILRRFLFLRRFRLRLLVQCRLCQLKIIQCRLFLLHGGVLMLRGQRLPGILHVGLRVLQLFGRLRRNLRQFLSRRIGLIDHIRLLFLGGGGIAVAHVSRVVQHFLLLRNRLVDLRLRILKLRELVLRRSDHRRQITKLIAR